MTCFSTGFYLFKVNLFVHGAGRRLDQRSKQLLAVVFLPSQRSVGQPIVAPLLSSLRYFWPPFFLSTNTSPMLLCCQALFPMTHRPQTDIFIIICIGFREALSLLVYRNSWYMDAQVCFLKVLFIIWIDHFFQNSTEISSDGRLKTLITFRLINLFDWSVPCQQRRFDLSTYRGRSKETLSAG